MMERRLFVGIPVPAANGARLAAYGRACAGDSRTARPTPAGNLHATACFIGAVDVDRIEPLAKTLAEAASGLAPFVMPFTGIKLAPPGRPATMVWATYDGGDAFARLAIILCGMAGKVTSIAPLHRPLAHVTLLRDRSVIRGPLPPFEGHVPPLAVDACMLYASETRPEGPVYLELVRFPLTGRI